MLLWHIYVTQKYTYTILFIYTSIFFFIHLNHLTHMMLLSIFLLIIFYLSFTTRRTPSRRTPSHFISSICLNSFIFFPFQFTTSLTHIILLLHSLSYLSSIFSLVFFSILMFLIHSRWIHVATMKYLHHKVRLFLIYIYFFVSPNSISKP
jgi:hypothetical protein